ncbi:hypothetical protein UPYG_G00284100 [Umbra pygmaea]|uniref:Uncharacterized protein n=1 Tax=Umbra pygmaea TaxID=75934 RepID=A0ABD0W3R3_UMBPY
MIIPDGNGTPSCPVCVGHTPCPPDGQTPPPLHRHAARPRNIHPLPRACGPSDPASSLLEASLGGETAGCQFTSIAQTAHYCGKGQFGSHQLFLFKCSIM